MIYTRPAAKHWLDLLIACYGLDPSTKLPTTKRKDLIICRPGMKAYYRVAKSGVHFVIETVQP